MKRRLAVFAACLFATAAHAQSLNDILSDLTTRMSHMNDEGEAAVASLHDGDLATACAHLANRSAYAEQAGADLDTMQATLDANTVMSDAARADWQGHIIDARGSIAQIADANDSTRARYCA